MLCGDYVKFLADARLGNEAVWLNRPDVHRYRDAQHGGEPGQLDPRRVSEAGEQVLPNLGVVAGDVGKDLAAPVGAVDHDRTRNFERERRRGRQHPGPDFREGLAVADADLI